MTFNNIKGDLFEVSNEYALCHCISADFRLGAGIAKTFNERFDLRTKLFEMYNDGYKIYSYKETPRYGQGISILTQCNDYNIFNLVTKKRYFDKPTYYSLEQSLISMRAQCDKFGITKIAMPMIGCGLDGLNWARVEKIIENVFKDINVEISVYYL